MCLVLASHITLYVLYFVFLMPYSYFIAFSAIPTVPTYFYYNHQKRIIELDISLKNNYIYEDLIVLGLLY